MTDRQRYKQKVNKLNFYIKIFTNKMRENILKSQIGCNYENTSIINPKIPMLVLLILLFFDLGQSQTRISIRPVLQTVNANTTYQFTIVDGMIRTIRNTSAVIQITFPSISFSFNTSQTFSCFSTDVPSLTYPCQAINNNVIQINNPLISTNIFSVSVSTIKNPSSVQYPTFQYVFKYSNSTNISQATSDIFRNYSPGPLQSCTVSFSPDIVHSTSQIYITISLGSELPKNGSISVLFPNKWTDSASSSFTPVISTSLQTCTKRSTGIFLNSPLACTATGQQINLRNSLNNTAVSGTTLSFSINNILSPPTVFNGNTITVTTSTQTGNDINRQVCSVISLQSKNIAGITSNVQLVVGTNSQFNFQFIAPAPISSDDKLTLSAVAPNDIYFALSTKQSGLIQPTTVLTGQFTNSTLVSLVFPSNMTVISTSTSISLGQGFYLKPLISSGSKSLVLSLKRNGHEYASQSFSLTIKPNNLINVTISLDDYTVSNVAVYNFTFILANKLGAKSQIVITLPSQLFIANGVCISSISASNSPSSINSSSTCIASSNRIISLGFVSLNSISEGQKLSIKINLITNSQTTQPTGSFSIQTKHDQSATQATDSSTNITVQMTPSTIAVANVGSSSPKVAEKATYTFSYTVKTKFLANSKIRIGLPADVIIGTSLSTVYSITYVNATTSLEQSCPVTNLTLNSTQYLQLTGISSVLLLSSTVITIKISQLVNPLSLKPTSSFSIYQIDSKGYQIEKRQAGLIITNTQLNSFGSQLYAVESSVRINGQTATYTISLQSAVLTTVGKNGQIHFSDPILPCEIVYTENATVKTVPSTCERQSSTQLKIKLGGSGISKGQTYQLSINSIQRARTAQIPSNITVKTFKYVSNSTSFGISSGIVVPLPNTKLNTIQSVSLNILTLPSQLFSNQSFSISVKVQNPLFSGDFMVIQVPSQLYTFTSTLVNVPSSSSFTELNLISQQSLCTQSQYFCSHYSSNKYRIKVQQFSSSFSSTSAINITVKNNLYLSPKTFNYQGYYFKAQTYTFDGLAIDDTFSSGSRVTNLTSAEFYLTCSTNVNDYHCKDCLQDGKCSSCYQVMNVSGKEQTFGNFKYLNIDSKCVSQCEQGYFISNSTTTATCKSCDSPCSTCLLSSTSCRSCLQTVLTNKYYDGNNTCLLTCPDGSYSDPGNICSPCSNDCKTCQSGPSTCISCSNPTFLNSATQTCVSSASCPFGTYADSNTNKCLSCSLSCNGCSVTSFNCNSCSTGYFDFSNVTSNNCTNNCPIGKVNDTINGLGCRCQSQCLTCEKTISTCLSCDPSSLSKYYYSSTCLTTCPQGTYAPNSGEKICKQCQQLNCKYCSAEACSQCSGQYLLYEGACLVTCPQGSVLVIELSVRKCIKCLVGCVKCDKGVNQCSTCESGYLKQGNSTSVYCTTACSSDNVNFNNSICYSSCPSGYENVNKICVQVIDNSTNENQITPQASQLSKTRTVPFPFTIASFIFVATILLSKLILPYSLVSTLISALVGLLEPISWIIVVIVTTLQTKSGQHWPVSQAGVYIIVVSLVTNMILNVIALMFFRKYIIKDQKFSQILSYNQKKVVLGKCPTISILILSVVLSHKLLQLLFSNFLGSKHFSYKLMTLTHIVPLNYVLYISLLPSTLVIAGGSIISYQLQSYATQSSSFVASLDMIIITLIGMISAIWVTNRKSEDYEHDVAGMPDRHYQTQEILVQGNNGHYDEFQQNFKEILIQESGVRNRGDKGKSYRYKTSRVSQRGRTGIGKDVHDNQPLAKKESFKRSFNNKVNIRGSKLSQQQSSQALVFEQHQKRRNLKDQFSQDSNGQDKNNQGYAQEDMQVIQLCRNEGSNGHPQDLPSYQSIPLISKMHYPNKRQVKQKPQQLLSMTNQEKQELKAKIQGQFDQEQKQKLGILNKQRQLKIKKKKQKIEQILRIGEEQQANLQQQDKAKVRKVKQAVDLLKRKHIRIQEYLLYAEIIRQEQGQDQSSEEDLEISEINQKTHTIIKGIQDEDDQLEEVINLSPKRNTILTKSIRQLAQNTGQNAFLQGPQENGQDHLHKTDSNGMGSKSKQKTTQKQNNKQPGNSKAKHHQKNKNKPNDLQVNYIANQNSFNKTNDPKQAYQYDSQQQPQLPKVRSNIMAKNSSKERNRSEKQIGLKIDICTNQDMKEADWTRQNGQNRTLSGMGYVNGQLQEEHVDQIPPRYLHCIEKADIKSQLGNNNPHMKVVNRNAYDSENDHQTLKSFQHPDMDFYNQISTSPLDVTNHKYRNIDQSSDMPIKPKIVIEDVDQNGVTIDKKIKNQKMKNDGFEIYQEVQLDEDEFNKNSIDRVQMQSRHIDSRINMSTNLYSNTNHLDQNQIMRKNYQLQKLKQLEKIYLPRQQPKAGKKNRTKRQLSTSKISKSKEKY